MTPINSRTINGSDELKNDQEIVLAAVTQFDYALQYFETRFNIIIQFKYLYLLVSVIFNKNVKLKKVFK